MSIECNGVAVELNQFLRFLGGLGDYKPSNNGLLEVDSVLESDHRVSEAKFRKVNLTQPVTITVGGRTIVSRKDWVVPVGGRSYRHDQNGCFKELRQVPVTDDVSGHWECQGKKMTTDDLKRFVLGYYIFPSVHNGLIEVESTDSHVNEFGRRTIAAVRLRHPLLWVVGGKPLAAYRVIGLFCGEMEQMTPHDFGFVSQAGNTGDEYWFRAEASDQGWHVVESVSRGGTMVFGWVDAMTDRSWQNWEYPLALANYNADLMNGLVAGHVAPNYI